MLDVQSSTKKFGAWGLPLPKRRGGGDPDFGIVLEYIAKLIDGVMDFYTHPRSEAVICPELIATINGELDYILPHTARHFDLEPINLVLRVRVTPDPGILKVRAENPNLC